MNMNIEVLRRRISGVYEVKAWRQVCPHLVELEDVLNTKELDHGS